ncbi:MAG: hypothetical protein KDE19_23340 [Caldilineaceae bacterium]|nr:hypothetical protein [Caldilineaceae bacterium]
MIIHILWGYLCVTGFASLFVYVACVAAARADRIRERKPWQPYLTEREQAEEGYSAKAKKSIYQQALFSSLSD